jgi:EAL and modified HD-GYP domain-containing signal transduction protein
MEKALVARQPIFDTEGGLFAYELLFRDSRKNSAQVTDNRFATAKVLSESFNSIGLKQIVENKKAFVNVDRDFLFDNVVDTIPAEHFILEILEDVEVDEPLVQRIHALKERGFAFAIDDMSLNDENFERFKPLFAATDIAKIDLTLTGNIDALQQKLDYLSSFDIRLLAEKVESADAYEQCKAMGFDYFQGYFFAKPTIMEAKKLDPGHASLIKIIEKINTGADVNEIEREFNNNPNLTVNMLRYINSSIFSTKKEISSIPQAINMLGRYTLVQWLTLNLYSSNNTNKYKDSILQSVMLRAEIMLSLVNRYKLGKEKADKAYLVGLLSLLHALLHIPLENLFREIPFDKEIVEAVLSHEGVMGKLLKLTTIFEQGHFPSIQRVLQKIKMNEGELTDMLSTCYVNVINRSGAL